MKKTISIFIVLTLITFSISGCRFFNPKKETISATESEYTLNQKIELVGISYYIPSDFDTKGKYEDDEMINHTDSNGDNLFVVYLGYFDDSGMSMVDRHIELSSIAHSMVDSDDVTDVDYEYSIVENLDVVKFSYSTSTYYIVSYTFFENEGTYCMSFFSNNPVTRENEKLLESVVKTVTPTEKPIMQITTEKPTEELTEEPTTVEETEPVTTETIIIDDLVFNDDKVNVFYTGYDVDRDGDYRIHMRIENNSNADWEFVLMDTSIDNYVIDPIFHVTVPSGKNANEDIFIFDTTLTKNNIEKINTIEFKIHYFDTINQIGEKESYTTDVISIEL